MVSSCRSIVIAQLHAFCKSSIATDGLAGSFPAIISLKMFSFHYGLVDKVQAKVKIE